METLNIKFEPTDFCLLLQRIHINTYWKYNVKKDSKKKFSDLCPNLLNPYVDSQREQQTISCQERKKMVHLEILQLVLLPSWTLTRISTTATTFVEGFGIYKAASFPKLGSLSIHSLHIEWYNYNNPSRFLGFDHNTRILWRVREKFDIARKERCVCRCCHI